MIGNTHLNEIINRENIYETDKILDRLHERIVTSLDQEHSGNDDGMDLCLCRIEYLYDGKVKVNFTGAKRPVYFLNELGKMMQLKADRISIGGTKRKKNARFSSKEIVFRRGTVLYLTSDGFIDQCGNDQSVRYGTARLLDKLAGLSSFPMERQSSELDKELTIFSEQATQRDDVTIMGIRL
ncbi:SpoIIE family protein phosphatase [Limibacter armeniacum]|uniref:PP2C family protein-serine/threonine phosphatase n=1 Tax=Limibacter armeniacum TaxID=466084 RepID=UPI002FE62823